MDEGIVPRKSSKKKRSSRSNGSGSGNQREASPRPVSQSSRSSSGGSRSQSSTGDRRTSPKNDTSSSSSKPRSVSRDSRSSSNGSSSLGKSQRSSVNSAEAQRSGSSSPKTKKLDKSLTGIDAEAKPRPSSKNSTRSTSGSSQTSGQTNSTGSNNSGGGHKYTVKELINSLGVDDDVELPPALERRVRDFKFAQSKRRDRHGAKKPFGIFGLYAHLSDIRADLEWAEDAAWRRQQKQPYLSWTDFEKTHRGANNRPWFTYGIIALCTVMFVVTIAVNGWSVEPLNVNPLIGPSGETLVKCGARDTDLIVNEGEWFRLFTPMILHAGLVHYVINMLAMWFVGGAVEQSHGSLSAAVLFCVPAVGGNILSALCLPQYISVGASGGIFGLIGGCVADITINWHLLFLKTTADEDTRFRHFMVLFWLFLDILVNCLIGLTPLVDNFTHLGGLLYGLSCGLSTIERLAVGFFGVHSGKYAKHLNMLMRFGGLIVSVVAIMVTTVLLSNSDGLSSPCHGCRYISCVPFPPGSQDKWWHCDDCDFVTADLFVAADGSRLYELIELSCPNGDIESIQIADQGMTDREDVRLALPGYCRAHCENVFKQH
jgi:membrane associated rhomboid family serine protease